MFKTNETVTQIQKQLFYILTKIFYTKLCYDILLTDVFLIEIELLFFVLILYKWGKTELPVYGTSFIIIYNIYISLFFPNINQFSTFIFFFIAPL